MANLILLLFLSFLTSIKALQFCTDDWEDSRVKFCVGVSSSSNATARTEDLHLTLLGSFHNSKGWGAVGVGERMSGALMFVLYPGATEEDGMTVSIRTTMNHSPPRVSDAVPIYEVTRKYKDGYGNNVVDLTCFACNQWDGTSLDLNSPSQPWIWAKNIDEKVRSNEIDSAIYLHDEYGKFHLEMRSAQVKYSEGMAPQAPGVTFPFVSSSTEKGSFLDKLPVAELHGTLMISSFLLFTVGIGIIVIKVSTSFILHWVIQLSAAGLCTAGCALGIWMSQENQPETSQMRKSHQSLGFFVYFTILVQMGTGYLHHRIFIRKSRRSTASYIHIWAGRLIWIAGTLNSFLGLKTAESSRSAILLWSVLCVLEVMILLAAYQKDALLSYLGASKLLQKLPFPRGQPLRENYKYAPGDEYQPSLEMDEYEDGPV